MASPRTRRLSWSAPLLVFAVIALIAAIPGLSAAAPPNLAPVTPQQLIAKVEQATVTSLSGTLKLTTNLGIPNVSALSGALGGDHRGNRGFNPTDLLTGSHEARVWVGGAQRERIALIQDMAETDLIRNGTDAWLWDSTTKKVTHFTLTPKTTNSAGGDKDAGAPEVVKTPEQEASDLLAHLDPSTAVSVGATTSVAGHDAYQLELAPKTAASTVDHVAIAVDAGTGTPLQVQVFAKGQKAPALSLGFEGSLSFDQPSASLFTFTPPPGATVTENQGGSSHEQATSGAGHDSGAAGGKPVTVGEGWAKVTIFPNVQVPPQLNDFLNAATPVHGSFGTGRLLETPLVNLLLLGDGRVAVGAVNVPTLEAAVGATP